MYVSCPTGLSTHVCEDTSRIMMVRRLVSGTQLSPTVPLLYNLVELFAVAACVDERAEVTSFVPQEFTGRTELHL